MVSAIEKQVLQSQVMERIQQVQQQHPDMQQQYFNIQLAQERRRMKNKVKESDEIYHAKVDDEDEGKQQKDDLRGRSAVEQDVDEKMPGEQTPLDHIDIKV